MANSVLNKGKSAIPPLFSNPEVLSSTSDKATWFGEYFYITFIIILMTHVSLHLFFLLELI